MFSIIKNILSEEGIHNVGIININDCDIINERILPQNAKSVIMFSIPYRSTFDIENDGFSEYARIHDYHQFSQELYKRVIRKMQEQTGFEFYGFCDHSPINEKLAIAKSGSGTIGRHSLFIDDEYGTFVFLGSIITNMPTENATSKIAVCENCGKCASSCPNSAITERGLDRCKCLSAISQKKTKTDEEKKLLKDNNIVWGCDICQNVCPHNQKAKISPLDFFSESRISKIDKNFILQLSDDEFKKFAFAYKGRNLILNNIEFK